MRLFVLISQRHHFGASAKIVLVSFWCYLDYFPYLGVITNHCPVVFFPESSGRDSMDLWHFIKPGYYLQCLYTSDHHNWAQVWRTLVSYHTLRRSLCWSLTDPWCFCPLLGESLDGHKVTLVWIQLDWFQAGPETKLIDWFPIKDSTARK